MRTLGEIAVGYAENLEQAYDNGELNEVIDDRSEVEYTLDSHFNLIGVKVFLALGVPDVFLNTRYNRIEAYSETEEVFVPVDRDVCNEVFAMYEDYFNRAR